MGRAWSWWWSWWWKWVCSCFNVFCFVPLCIDLYQNTNMCTGKARFSKKNLSRQRCEPFAPVCSTTSIDFEQVCSGIRVINERCIGVAPWGWSQPYTFFPIPNILPTVRDGEPDVLEDHTGDVMPKLWTQAFASACVANSLAGINHCRSPGWHIAP